MKKQIIALVVSTFSFVISPISNFANAESVASGDAKYVALFLVVAGTVNVQAADGTEEKAKVGLQVFEGDKITVDVDSKAKLVTVDRNVIVLGEKSELLIQRYQHQTENAKQVELSLAKGSIRSSVNQKYEAKDEYYRVITPTAMAGVRGTDFLTEFHPDTKENVICTFKGNVSFRLQGAGAQAGPEESITAGKFLRHQPGQAFRATDAKPEWIQKNMQRLEIRGGDERMNMKPVQRMNPVGGQRGQGPQNQNADQNFGQNSNQGPNQNPDSKPNPNQGPNQGQGAMPNAPSSMNGPNGQMPNQAPARNQGPGGMGQDSARGQDSQRRQQGPGHAPRGMQPRR